MSDALSITDTIDDPRTLGRLGQTQQPELHPPTTGVITGWAPGSVFIVLYCAKAAETNWANSTGSVRLPW